MKIKVVVLSIIFFVNVMYGNEHHLKSVVKIYSSLSFPDYKNPWQTSKIKRITGSGAIIDNNMILTSAHVVSNSVFTEVKKENDPKKYLAKIKYISHQVDLALLEIIDSEFFKNTVPLKLNNIAKHRERITVLGYPMGGNNISTTTGVISRIEYSKYTWSKEDLLSIQIDAAINSGNSGGPAINKNGELVGIAMQKLNNSSNISYIVPSIIIDTFLADIKDGKVDGFHFDSTVIKEIENDSMKKYYGLNNGNGILTTFTDINETNLKVNDIILEIDGIKVANNQTIASKFGRVNYKLLFHTKQLGEKLSLKVLRDKQVIDIKYKLKRSKKLIYKEFNKNPRYLIYGGLTFTPLTRNYLKTLDLREKEIDMLFYQQKRKDVLSELVVLMQTIFPHNVNRGYKSSAQIITHINGIKVKNFKHFTELIDNLKQEFTVIDFLEKKRIILNTKKSKKSFKDLSKRYRLTSDRNY